MVESPKVKTVKCVALDLPFKSSYALDRVAAIVLNGRESDIDELNKALDVLDSAARRR